VSSTTGLILSYAIGLIFLVGGIVFLAFLDDNRLLFGVPYVILGLVLVGGVWASQRRRTKTSSSDAGALDGDASSTTKTSSSDAGALDGDASSSDG
jgi:hypothetical protein